MKTSFVSLLALAAGAFAGRIGTVGSLYERDQTITVTTLTETVKTYTSSISKFQSRPYSTTLYAFANASQDTTLASLPENPTAAEQTTALNAITPKLEDISDVLHAATKASASTAFLDVDTSDLVSTVEGLVNEIVYTVKAVVEKLGLGELFITHTTMTYDLLIVLIYSERSPGCPEASVHRSRQPRDLSGHCR